MNIEIKRASIKDLEDIQRLNNQLFELEYTNFDPTLKVGWPFEIEGIKYFTDILNNEAAFIALVDNKVVAYLAGSINVQSSYTTKPCAELDNMFILEEYRNYGIGTKLINAFKAVCLEEGIEEIKVTAFAKNTNAINFYKKNGFKDFEVTLKVGLL